MFRKLASAAFGLMFFSLSANVVSAQNSFGETRKCPQPVYAASDVTRSAKILEGPYFGGVRDRFSGHVRLEAVFCRTGRITDIRIIEGSSPTVNDFASVAVGLVRFVPAELNWHTVSQRIQLEIEIENGDVKGITIRPTRGQLVESVNVIGNRRLDAKGILALIQTRAGEPYDEAQVKLDFEKLLATGQFDKLTTRVFTQVGVRGGFEVYFELHELPVVGAVSLEGLKIDPALVRKAWKDAQIDLQTGAPYWPEAGKAAIRIIKQVLDAKAVNYSNVELRTDQPVALTVNLTFVISNQ
ncbi:MAG TPA: POTRA domain-containing protein [Pyrinomonadaceae bacterium]|nr:POTRA domain-containing protein [Pyrinomonadaceae bacterium]